MKKLYALFVLLLLAGSLFAQKKIPQDKVDAFIPNTFGASSSVSVAMSARVAATTYADTTKWYPLRGALAAWVEITTSSANDSSGEYVYYRTSPDGGITPSGKAFVLIDSVITTAVSWAQTLAVPTAALGSHSIQFLVKGTAASTGGYSANPTTKVTTRVIIQRP
jgi:hypothetical protein